jgi:hypothetical protein
MTAPQDLIRQRTDLLGIVQRVVDWNTKYPSHRIYPEYRIREIAAEMDAIAADAQRVIAEVTCGVGVGGGGQGKEGQT